MLQSGSRLGPYEIVAPLGAGGMGEVYRARDTRLGREVAIKVLPATVLADQTARTQLLREARLAASLNHPHICTIYEVGETGGEVYLAMEYVNGRQAKDLIPIDGLPLETVVRYGMQLADAVGHAHDHGIVHRDLKTANVLVTIDGRVKVLDFGIAIRRTGELEEVTRSLATLDGQDVVAGTLPYMAPEVLRGVPADSRSDVWALGVMLYEMASGHRPFQGQSGVELTSAILRDTPKPLPSHCEDRLSVIVEKCLAKDPTQRYRTGAEVHVALESASPRGESRLGEARSKTARRLWKHPAASGVVVALALIALMLFNAPWSPSELRPPPDAARYSSVAVLPLKNFTGDSSQEFLTDGLTDALIGDLTQLGQLRVVSLTSVLQYKGSTKPLLQIAKELNVDTVVEGSVVRAGDRVRISAHLVDALSDRSLWSDSFERDLGDVLATQREISRTIAGRISAFTPDEQLRLSPLSRLNPDAYLAYQRGRFYWNQRTESSLKLGIEQFNLALEADPTYALAYSGLADCYAALGYGSYLAPDDAFPKARAAAEKALELDSSLAAPHATLGYVRLYYEWKFADAEDAFRRSLELNPNYATAHHWYSVYLTAMERPTEARREIEAARALDPLSVAVATDMGFEQYYSRDYEGATKQLRSIVEINPNFSLAHLWLGRTYQQRKMYAEAISEYEQTGGLREWVPTLAALGHVYGLQGRTAEARKVLAHLDEIARERYVTSYGVALVYAGMGDKEQAFSKLEQAFDERSHWLVWLNLDPRWDSLRADPRFDELKRRLGLGVS
jgi:serine/threonine-protein kinase